jgi:hypothetical protein
MKKNSTIIGLVGVTLLLLSCTPDDVQVEGQKIEKIESYINEKQLDSIEFTTNEVFIEYDEEGNPLNPKDKG